MVKLVFVPKLRDAIQLVVDMVSLQLVVELGLLVFYWRQKKKLHYDQYRCLTISNPQFLIVILTQILLNILWKVSYPLFGFDFVVLHIRPVDIVQQLSLLVGVLVPVHLLLWCEYRLHAVAHAGRLRQLGDFFLSKEAVSAQWQLRRRQANASSTHLTLSLCEKHRFQYLWKSALWFYSLFHMCVLLYIAIALPWNSRKWFYWFFLFWFGRNHKIFQFQLYWPLHCIDFRAAAILGLGLLFMFIIFTFFWRHFQNFFIFCFWLTEYQLTHFNGKATFFFMNYNELKKL